MSWDLAEQWADGIPFYSENDPQHPEWKCTPLIPLDLSVEGCGLVYVKNEADKQSNPTGTIKDRPAWELATLYRDYARGLCLRRQTINGEISSLPVPRFSLITAGNVGHAVSHAFQRYGLPPMKLLVDVHIPQERLERLQEMYADVYLAPLRERPLSVDDIKRVTNNEDGIDITSVMVLEPYAIFYDWHVHEVFNEKPDEIFVPYGSGRLFENFLTWQERSLRYALAGHQDPRLRIPAERVVTINISGGEPEQSDSKADKLTKLYNPFVLFRDQDIATLHSLSFTGRETGVYKVPEEYITHAYLLLSQVCETEPSAAVGLALYLQRWDKGKVDPCKKIVVVNTGRGI